MKKIVFSFVISSLLSFSCAQKPVPKPDSINISVPYEVDSLDPHAKDTISNFAVLSNLYEPLVRTDADMKIQPCLAKSWENPDMDTWIFHLQPSVTFHNGRRMTAEDVVYSFERLLKTPELEMKGFITSIGEISAEGRLKVKIRMKRRLSVLLNKLNFVMIVPKGSTSESLSKKVDGTGPYALVEWKKGEKIAIVRYDKYWGKKPALRQVNFFLQRSPEEAIQDLSSGRCQLVQSNSKKLEKAVHSVNRYEMLRRNSLFVKYLTFDVWRTATPYCSVKPNPFRQKSVRQAIDLAIDRGAIVSAIAGYGIPAAQPVPTFVFGHNPAILPAPSDPGHARMLLTQSGFPKGFEVTLHARQILQGTAFLVRDQLLPIGIRVKVEVMQDPEWFQSVNEFSFFLTRLGCPTGDASDVLELAFHSFDSLGLFGSRNYGRYSDPEVDGMIEESAGIPNISKRQRVLQDLMARLTEETVWVPLYTDEEVYAIEKSFSWQPRNDSYILAQEIELQ